MPSELGLSSCNTCTAMTMRHGLTTVRGARETSVIRSPTWSIDPHPVPTDIHETRTDILKTLTREAENDSEHNTCDIRR